MTGSDLTGVVAAVVSIITAGLVPWLVARRKGRTDTDTTQVASWQGMNDRLDREARELRTRLDQMELDHAAAIRQLNTEWQAKLDRSDKKIALQQDEIDDLRRQLGHQT